MQDIHPPSWENTREEHEEVEEEGGGGGAEVPQHGLRDLPPRAVPPSSSSSLKHGRGAGLFRSLLPSTTSSPALTKEKWEHEKEEMEKKRRGGGAEGGRPTVTPPPPLLLLRRVSAVGNLSPTMVEAICRSTKKEPSPHSRGLGPAFRRPILPDAKNVVVPEKEMDKAERPSQPISPTKDPPSPVPHTNGEASTSKAVDSTTEGSPGEKDLSIVLQEEEEKEVVVAVETLRHNEEEDEERDAGSPPSPQLSAFSEKKTKKLKSSFQRISLPASPSKKKGLTEKDTERVHQVGKKWAHTGKKGRTSQLHSLASSSSSSTRHPRGHSIRSKSSGGGSSRSSSVGVARLTGVTPTTEKKDRGRGTHAARETSHRRRELKMIREQEEDEEKIEEEEEERPTTTAMREENVEEEGGGGDGDPLTRVGPGHHLSAFFSLILPVEDAPASSAGDTPETSQPAGKRSSMGPTSQHSFHPTHEVSTPLSGGLVLMPSAFLSSSPSKGGVPPLLSAPMSPTSHVSELLSLRTVSNRQSLQSGIYESEEYEKAKAIAAGASGVETGDWSHSFLDFSRSSQCSIPSTRLRHAATAEGEIVGKERVRTAEAASLGNSICSSKSGEEGDEKDQRSSRHLLSHPRNRESGDSRGPAPPPVWRGRKGSRKRVERKMSSRPAREEFSLPQPIGASSSIPEGDEDFSSFDAKTRKGKPYPSTPHEFLQVLLSVKDPKDLL